MSDDRPILRSKGVPAFSRLEFAVVTSSDERVALEDQASRCIRKIDIILAGLGADKRCLAAAELGWGDWWFWDPVENPSLMPWLYGPAMLHSAQALSRSISRRRRLFGKLWLEPSLDTGLRSCASNDFVGQHTRRGVWRQRRVERWALWCQLSTTDQLNAVRENSSTQMEIRYAAQR